MCALCCCAIRTRPRTAWPLLSWTCLGAISKICLNFRDFPKASAINFGRNLRIGICKVEVSDAQVWTIKNVCPETGLRSEARARPARNANANRNLTLCHAALSILRGVKNMDMQPLAKSPIQPERRYTQRRKYFGKIEIEWGSATLIGTVRDIGPQGMFIELSPPLWLGATFFA